MKLEVGMHIRINGFISKIGHINTSKKGNTYIQFKQPNGLLITMNTKFLDDEKASHNIIDLIEENDFINGLRVEKNKYGELYTSYVYYGGGIGKQCEVYTTWLKEYTEDMIENIVTKEQFESIKYSLEG